MATTATAPGTSPLAEAAAQLKRHVDCDELAQRLGLKRKGSSGNFENPNTEGHSASLACYPAGAGKPSMWKDHRTEEHGDAIALYQLKAGCDFPTAVRELARMFGVEIRRPNAPAPRVEQTLPEFIAEKCLRAVADDDGRATLLNYLEGRGITRQVIEGALRKRALGLNTYTSTKVARGEVNYCGPAAAFLVRAQNTGQVVAVDMRYLAPEDNGGVKTQSQGEKVGFPWTSDWRRVEAARTVYIVESSINALSIECCPLAASAAIALRGTGNVDTIDWSFLRGKQVVAVLDNDEPHKDGHPKAGYCAGLLAAWRLHEVLTGLDISCVLVDQSDWFEDVEAREGPINDVNDYLQAHGPDDTAKALAKLDTWMIPGMSGDDKRVGKPRLYLPAHDYHAYWKYRVQLDFTRVVSKVDKDDDGNQKLEFQDVAGFRIAAVSRVQIASAASTMTGDADHSPRTVFALSVQTARHGPRLQRRVVDDEKLHNLDVWKKLGPVYAPTPFARLVNVWERAAGIGARDAVNFVGLAWRDGLPVVNEGPDCFFADPRQQCPYSDLVFPSGAPRDALTVLQAFTVTFSHCAALIPLVWGLGAHLKAFLGFWPHFVMQAEKATGKSTLVKRIERAIAMTTKSRQSLQTEFRQLTSMSYTSHPVGWGEMSTNKQDIINKAISNLQESYQYEYTQRGAELIEFLLCAPVMLSGEDVPVDSLVGKLVRSELTKERRGPLIPEDLPVFPVKQWLQFLARQDKARVQEMHRQQVAELFDRCLAVTSDSGAERMVHNYAAVGTAWELLCEFTDQPVHTADFLHHLTAEMNGHVRESAAERQPWAWVIEKLLSEIAAGQYRHPFRFDEEDEVAVLCVRTGHVMDHMRQTNYLREFWDGLPIKSDRALKKQLVAAGVLATDRNGVPLDVERTVKGQRVGHMVALSLPALREFGLHAVVPVQRDEALA